MSNNKSPSCQLLYNVVTQEQAALTVSTAVKMHVKHGSCRRSSYYLPRGDLHEGPSTRPRRRPLVHLSILEPETATANSDWMKLQRAIGCCGNIKQYPYLFFAQEPPTTSKLAHGVDGLSAQRILTCQQICVLS